MTNSLHTFCRICEPNCALTADLDAAGKVARLRPDPGHPAGGLACHKGLSFLDVHYDPDRLNWPQRRLNPRSESVGHFEQVEWTDAISDIGARLRALRDQGPDKIAIFAGNPTAFSAASIVTFGMVQKTIGTRMLFSSATLDMTNKQTAAAAVFGSSTAWMVPDIYNTDYLLVLGSNPKVSRWTIVSTPNDPDVVKKILRRGGKVRFVNPRKTESSTIETGPTLQIRPGSDVYFLAALLHEIDRRDGFDMNAIERYGKNLAGLRAFVERYPPERVARLTGLDASVIREVADELLSAKSASVYMATGVNQSRQGILCSWLVEMITFTTGNLGRLGGAYKPYGLLNHYAPTGATQRIDTSLGTLELHDSVHFVPATLLPDLIESGDIRALIVICGNPLLSMGGEERLRNAFEKLELMVSVDIYRNATAEMCDYVLAATDWLERADINLAASGLQTFPYVQYTDPVEAPAAGRRSEWWILSKLLQAMELPSPLDNHPEDDNGNHILGDMLAAGGLSIKTLREAPHQTVTFPPEPRDALFERCLQHPDKRIDCCPSLFEEAGLLDRCEAIFAEMASEASDILHLIGLRTTHMHNSWFSNVGRLRQGLQATNPLHICEADAAARGLHDGDTVTISNPHGSIETRILIDDELRPGAVAMSHGYGHQASYGMRAASRKPGVNSNRLMPVGSGVAEPLSNMSWLSGVPVRVQRVNSMAGDDA